MSPFSFLWLPASWLVYFFILGFFVAFLFLSLSFLHTHPLPSLHPSFPLSGLPSWPHSVFIFLLNKRGVLFTLSTQVPVVQSLSRVQIFATPRTAARQAYLSFTVSWSLLRLMPTELVMPSNHVILWHPLVSSCPQSFPASGSFHPIRCYRASQLTQGWRICLPMQDTPVWSLGWGDSSGEGNGSPLQYSFLGDPMDRGAWWAIVHGVTKSLIWLKWLRKHTLGAIRKCFQAKVSGTEEHYLHNVMTKLHQKKWWCLTQVFIFIMQKNNNSSPMGINIRGNWIQKRGGRNKEPLNRIFNFFSEIMN